MAQPLQQVTTFSNYSFIDDYKIPDRKAIKQALSNCRLPFAKDSEFTIKSAERDLLILEIAVSYFAKLKSNSKRTLIKHRTFLSERVKKEEFNAIISCDHDLNSFHNKLIGIFFSGISPHAILPPKKNKFSDWETIKTKEEIEREESTAVNPLLIESESEYLPQTEELVPVECETPLPAAEESLEKDAFKGKEIDDSIPIEDDSLETCEIFKTLYQMKNDNEDPLGSEAIRIRIKKANKISEFFQNFLFKYYLRMCPDSNLSQVSTQRLIAKINLRLPEFIQNYFFPLPNEFEKRDKSFLLSALSQLSAFLNCYIEAYKFHSKNTKGFKLKKPREQKKLDDQEDLLPADKEKLLAEKMADLLNQKGMKTCVSPLFTKEGQLLLIGEKLSELYNQIFSEEFSLLAELLTTPFLLALNELICPELFRFLLYRLVMLDFSLNMEGEPNVPRSIFEANDKDFSKEIGNQIEGLMTNLLELGDASLLLKKLTGKLVKSGKTTLAEILEKEIKRIYSMGALGFNGILILDHLLFQNGEPIFADRTIPIIPEPFFNQQELRNRLSLLFKNQGPTVVKLIAKVSSIEDFFDKISHHLLSLTESPLLSLIAITAIIDGLKEKKE